MSTLNTALYASVATDATRQAYAAQLRAQQELVAAQLSNTVKVSPGSTVTALYQYKVAPDGSLYPTQTRITTESATGLPEKIPGQSSRQEQNSDDYLRRQSRNRTPRFADFTPVRAQLSPTEELALFAAAGNDSPAALPEALARTPNTTPSTQNLTIAKAQEADGTPIEVEVLPPQTGGIAAANDNAEPVSSLAARNQTRVANLYARNNDIVFNVTPLSQFAA
ncbi:MAG: hypothetical protein ACKVOE_00115 [Rickettsiales bacterium]